MRNSRRLLLSIHDVSPRFSAPVETLAGILAEEVGAGRFAMLVVPDFWNEAPLLADRAFVARLRSWAALGVEMFVHGWCHRDESRHRGAIARVKARHMTAGEGEFLGLSREEAMERMRRGRDVVEQAIGRPVAGFIAPAWLYGQGAIEAAGALGFDLAEDHMKVWSPARSRVLARGPVVVTPLWSQLLRQLIHRKSKTRPRGDAPRPCSFCRARDQRRRPSLAMMAS